MGSTFANVVWPTFGKSDAKDFLLSMERWKSLDDSIWRQKSDEKGPLDLMI
jgi:hypothetical protein